MHIAPQSIPKIDSYESEAIQALVRSELMRGPGVGVERIADALQGIGFAVLHAAEKPSVTEMIAHCAETDHVLDLRLIDTEVFGVRCSGEHCAFRTEWRV